MANIETLISQITDRTLRQKLAAEVGALKKRLSWGLVFERHLPENVRLLSAPIRAGSVVWERRSAKPTRFRVRALDGEDLLVVTEPSGIVAPADAPAIRMARTEVLVEKDFADPVFPAFEPIGAVRRGSAERPSHVVIEGENYHALEALQATYRSQVDVLYLDPPYNTANRSFCLASNIHVSSQNPSVPDGVACHSKGSSGSAGESAGEVGLMLTKVRCQGPARNGPIDSSASWREAVTAIAGHHGG